jgi:hypothetical protein
LCEAARQVSVRSAKPYPEAGEPDDGCHLYEVELAARGARSYAERHLVGRPSFHGGIIKVGKHEVAVETETIWEIAMSMGASVR